MWESVLTSLRMAIIRGELAAGTHLLEVRLAKELGVSRGPVREALVHLEKEGLVTNEPYRGKFVTDISTTTIHEIYSLRRLLECHAAASAIHNINARQVDQLQDRFSQMMRAVREQRFEEFATIDLEFHRLLVTADGNRRLLQMWETLTGVTHAFITVNASQDQHGYRVIAQSHEAILKAVQTRDKDALQTALTDHLDGAERELLQIMHNRY